MNTSDLQTLEAAKDQARKRLEENPCRENFEAFEKACHLLDTGSKQNQDLLFKNRLEALEHIVKLGYKLSRGKLYKDSAAGLLRLQADGRVLEKDVDRYVKLAGLQKPAEIDVERKSEELTLATKEQELAKVTEQVLKMRKEREALDGKYVLREDLDMELAARAAVLEAGLKNLFITRAAEWIELAGGLSDKAHAVADAMALHLDELLTEYATMGRFQVIFEAQEKTEND